LKQREIWIAILLTLALAFSLSTAIAFADDSATDQELQIERQLGCPICTNLPLNICDNQICASMKGVIRQKLDAGESSNQIIDYFVARYGDGVLLTPPNRGFNLAVWYGPAVAVLLGGLLVWVLLRGSLRRQKELGGRLTNADPGLDAYRSRVRREVEGIGDSP
jgi:cytochrome c-type biogenesis protein CcmH